jgi:hypothetical protein
VATITWHVPNPSPNFVRARIKGFVMGIGSTNCHISGQYLEFDYLYPIYHGRLKIADRFWTPTSNVYSLDYVFDAADSSFTLSATPIDALVYLDLVFVPDDQHYRINVLSNVGVEPSAAADLSPLSGYWNPPYP